MKNSIFKLIVVETLLLLTINCAYTFNDVVDGAIRVNKYMSEKGDLPNIVSVASNEVRMAEFTYAMGVAIKNIYENHIEKEISTIKLEAPTSLHRCTIEVKLEDYIDAINRILNYCKNEGAAPAYVISSSVNIGYKEYSFGFSKILNFYHFSNFLPILIVFSTDDFEGGIFDVKFLKGINEINLEDDINKYITSSNSACSINEPISIKAKELTKGKYTPLEKATALFNFVRDKISYREYYNSKQGAAKTLLLGSGNGCDQANLLVALCRASEIPAKFAHGRNINLYFEHKTLDGHVWVQILIGNNWYVADPMDARNSLGRIVNWDINKFNRLSQYVNLTF